jgi:hypothetical protein
MAPLIRGFIICRLFLADSVTKRPGEVPAA